MSSISDQNRRPNAEIRDGDKPSDAIRNALLTVAVLLVAATYQAVYNPPCGLWQEDGLQNGTATIKQVAGVSILGTRSMSKFIMFILGNTVGFLLSMSSIHIHTSGLPHKKELDLAMVSISFSYGICVASITPSEYYYAILATYYTAVVIWALVLNRKQMAALYAKYCSE